MKMVKTAKPAKKATKSKKKERSAQGEPPILAKLKAEAVSGDTVATDSSRPTPLAEDEPTRVALPDFGEPLGENGDYERSQMKTAKAWVWKQERRNLDKIYFWRSPGGDKKIKWWKAGGVSAIFMVHVVYPMLGVDRDLYDDSDTDYNFPTGTTSARGIESTKERLGMIGIDVVAENGLICVFQLRRTYTEEQVKEMIRKAAQYREFAKHTLKEIRQYKDLENLLRELMKLSYIRYKNGNSRDGDYILLEYAKVARRAYTKLRDIATGRKEELEGFQELELLTDFLGENLYPMAEMGIWQEKSINRAAPIITRVRQIVRKRVIDALH